MEKNNMEKGGKFHFSFIKVMAGYDLSVRRIPVMEVKSERPGPTVVLTACMHGDEIGGTVVVQELFKILKNSLVSGRIVAFPLLNPFGFENTSRRISLSDEDLNRSFPGKHKGTLAQRIAALLMDKILELDPAIVLDLHNDWNKSIPYVLIDRLPEQATGSGVFRFAKISGLPAIIEEESIKNSFSYSVNSRNIAALTLELGESLLINEKNVKYGTTAILNILQEMEMITGIENAEIFNLPDYAVNRILTYSSEPLCSSSGIIRFSKKPGEMVRKGEKIARVYNAFGKLTETIVSVQEGVILGHNDYAVAYPGSPVMAFGVFMV